MNEEKMNVAKVHTDDMASNFKNQIVQSIKNSTRNSEYLPTFLTSSTNKELTKKTTVMVTHEDSVTAISSHIKGKRCILNFASYVNPGGGFIEGSMAQEQALCHASNLYNILLGFKDWYVKNSQKTNNGLYHSNMLFIPDVLFFDKGNNKVTYCDVITCAAPNSTEAIDAGVSYETVTKAMKARIDHILYCAYMNHVDTLILGAFGCGAFGNNPTDVAKIFRSLLTDKYAGRFDQIVFAVPGGDRNYEIFAEILGSL